MGLIEIRIAGFGGQGVILSAMVIGKAACIFDSGYATLTQNFGPEARGGACSAQVLISTSPIYYPYVTNPDILILMSQAAYTKFLPELKEGGLLIVEQDLVQLKEVPEHVRIHQVPATRLAEELGKRMVLNVVMVGFFAAVTDVLDPAALRKAVADSVPEVHRDLNLRAFERGFQFGVSTLRCLSKEGDSLQDLTPLEGLP